jgi:hypothetical protein
MAVGAGGAERWNGRSWRHVKPAGRVATLFSVSCARPSRCIAVGQTGTLALAEPWDGTRWLLLRTRNPQSRPDAWAEGARQCLLLIEHVLPPARPGNARCGEHQPMNAMISGWSL